ncbi:LytTR family DNA-binding domain-containing protein [Chitinophaga horti]|uniref:LytTR family DNA-binding domain-containing protein n=1 Tax=Chitinophaga horti TaxID=2920382 RepID=A0ABY6J2Y5_9BACT|nr:LytTR family DNA-binding domain-containing protein [Chitinophaga horti]UYQ94025.1 LytTR family DNA-binding domain-containing protein [Chitinophaga horti]
MKVLIIEDEALSAHHLKNMLREVDPDIEVTAVLDSIESAVRYFAARPQLDLIFMDIELGDGQSFEIFNRVNVDWPVIFTTAYQEHALKAFKLNSVDYLLKPMNREEVMAAILKFRKWHAHRGTPNQGLNTMLGEMNGEAFKSRYLAKSGTRLISVSLPDIAYFYTKDKLQFIKTRSNQDFIIDKRLDEIEGETDPNVFFRVNRQFIVNYTNIEKVHTWFSGKLKVQVQPAAYEEIIVSRLRANEFKKWLGE